MDNIIHYQHTVNIKHSSNIHTHRHTQWDLYMHLYTTIAHEAPVCIL